MSDMDVKVDDPNKVCMGVVIKIPSLTEGME